MFKDTTRAKRRFDTRRKENSRIRKRLDSEGERYTPEQFRQAFPRRARYYLEHACRCMNCKLTKRWRQGNSLHGLTFSERRQIEGLNDLS